LLPLTPLRGEAGGHFAHVFQDSTGIHRCILLSSIGTLCLWHLTLAVSRA
jgi:hypothetical protein